MHLKRELTMRKTILLALMALSLSGCAAYKQALLDAWSDPP